MCAAPGSKTSQLLEIISRSQNDPPQDQGLVVANDADTDRAYMLVHQCKRFNSPLLVVTTHKGQSFPTLSAPLSSQSSNALDKPSDTPLPDTESNNNATSSFAARSLAPTSGPFFDRYEFPNFLAMLV